MNEISPRTRLGTLLLWFFLGGFGGHRFYTGKIVSGIFFIFTGGGLLIWWLVDGVMILTGSFKDKEGRPVVAWSQTSGAATLPPAMALAGAHGTVVAESHKDGIAERLRNSPYWIIAILLHALLLLIATFLVVFHVWHPGDIDGGVYGGGNEGVDVSPPPAQTQQVQQLQNQPTTSTQSFNQLAQAIATAGVGEWSVSQPSEVATAASVASANIAGTGRGIPGAYTGRIGSGRVGVGRKHGSNSSVEDAVNRALEWLKRHQNTDKNSADYGSWGDDFKTAMTGLAVLCFLAHGDVQGSEKYGDVVERGVNWLIKDAKSHDGLMGTNRNVEYQHAIATLALAENYAMAPTVPDLEETAKKAVAKIVQGQSPGGGWNYGYDKSGRVDTSVSGWNMQALKAAQLGQLGVEGLDNSLEQAVKFLKGQYNAGQGSFGYENANNGVNWEKRGVGVYNLQLMLDKVGDDRKKEWQKTDEVTNSLSAFLKDDRAKFDWEKSSGWVLYGWYYNTYMAFFAEGQYWTQWNGLFRDPLIRQQAKDGHWPLPPGENGWVTKVLIKNTDSDVYSTTLCCLMLQVYWRHLTTG